VAGYLYCTIYLRTYLPSRANPQVSPGPSPPTFNHEITTRVVILHVNRLGIMVCVVETSVRINDIVLLVL